MTWLIFAGFIGMAGFVFWRIRQDTPKVNTPQDNTEPTLSCESVYANGQLSHIQVTINE